MGMQNTVIMLIALVLIYFDLSILRKQDEALFRKIFSFPRWLAIFYPLLGVAIAVAAQQLQYFYAFFFIFIFPIYLIRRRRFRAALEQSDQYITATPSRLMLLADAVGLLWVWFFSMTGIVIAVAVIQEVNPYIFSALGEIMTIAVASSALLIFLIYRTIHRYPGLSFHEVIALNRGGQSWHKIITLPAILGFGVAAVTSFLVVSREIQPSTPLGDVLENSHASLLILAFMVMAVVFAPVLEEVIFRGYFFYVLTRYRGQIFAAFFIAIVFALLHVEQYWGDWLAISMVALLGFILSFLRAWTKTSLATMVTHFFYNATMTLLPVILTIVANPTYYQYQSQYQKLDFNGKETLLKASIDKNPKFSDSYNDLAWLYAETNVNLEEALNLIEQALELYPKRFAYLDTKAEILYRMGRLEEAIRIAEGLIQRYPKEEYAKVQLQKFREALIRQYSGESVTP